jgi:hypothetical protein
MTERTPFSRSEDDFDPFETHEQARSNWLQRRRDKAVEEILANRRGEYTVPTWVLAALLGLIVAGWIALILFT